MSDIIKNQGEIINSKSCVEKVASHNSTPKGVINEDKSNIGREFIRATINDTAKNLIRRTGELEPEKKGSSSPNLRGFSESKAYINKIDEKTLAKSKKSSTKKRLWKGIEDNVSQIGDDAGERSAGKASSAILRMPRYTKNVVKRAVGFGQFARYSAKVLKDVNSGVLEKKEAKLALLKRTKISLKGGRKALFKSSVRKIENFRGSDDVGIQAITKPRDALFKTVRTGQRLRNVFRKVNPANSLKNIQKKIRKTQQAAKYLYRFVTHAVKLLCNAIVLKTVGIVLLVILFIVLMGSLFSSCSAFFSFFSFKCTDEVLNEIHTYITILDSDLEYEYENVERNPKWSHIDKFHKNINMRPYTDTDKVISYLAIKHDDFTFESVKFEIDELHSQLYQITYREWTETIHHKDWTETINHLDVTLNGVPFDNYIETFKSTLFLSDEYQRYIDLLKFGGTTFRKELSSPFSKQNWKNYMSSRFGYRLDPFSKEIEMHNGIDFAMPGGTPINAVMGGQVTAKGNDPEGYGNFIVISSGTKSTLYAHCSQIFVNLDDTINRGDVIAEVGSTGTSTGDHLHLEYKKRNIDFNPGFFLEEK